MRIDAVEFDEALNASPNVNHIVMDAIEAKSVARRVMIVDKVKPTEAPTFNLDPGATCWQISPFGHPMTIFYSADQRAHAKRVKLPLHLFQMTSPPVNPAKSKELELAANHLLTCESLSFLTLLTTMIGSRWDATANLSLFPRMLRRGTRQMVDNDTIPTAVVCDKVAFEREIVKMAEYKIEDMLINGSHQPVGTMTIDGVKMRVFTYDVMSTDGGSTFLCSDMMGILSQAGALKFWKDPEGEMGIFSLRISMALMLREAVFAIRGEG